MADEQDDSPAPPPKPPRRRRRPVPTIELKATEVPTEPAEAPDAATSYESSPAAAEPPRAEEAAAYPAEAAPPPPPETPSSDTGAGPPPEEPPTARPAYRAARRPINWAFVRAAAAGALAAFLVFTGFWLADVFSRDDAESAALSERLTLAETRLREIASRPAPAVPDRQALDEVTARLGKLEAASPALPAPGDLAIAGRLAAVEEAIKSLQGTLADLARRADDNAAATREARGHADAALLAADAARAALERATKTLADEVSKSQAAAGDRALRLAVAAQALRAAVERGDPFAAEFAAVKPLAPDPQGLAPLEAFAASGVPTQAALARQLSELTPAMLRLADAPATTGSFLDRLQANAERLVRIRPIDEAAGDDPVAVIGRIEAEAARADIPGALTDLAKLPAPVRAPAADWIKQAEGRNAAVAASRRVAGDALAALGKSP